jgi:hypothetical protein
MTKPLGRYAANSRNLTQASLAIGLYQGKNPNTANSFWATEPEIAAPEAIDADVP